MKKSYKNTIYACFIGYIVQAIVNNFLPLLFLTFQAQYGISLTKITLLITFNFGVQLLVDFLSIYFVDRIGYRASIIIAHVSVALGFILLTILPEAMPDPFFGILIAVMIYAIGGGIIEVLISPIAEACPTENKEKTMSLLHSFYSWGHVAVVLLSTVFFAFIGIQSWKVLALLWAIIPVLNTVLFSCVPLAPLVPEEEEGLTLGELLRKRIFWVFILLMICAGGSEHAIAQWASTFAEKALGISKTVGDLAGPLSFAICTGISRLLYGKYGEKMKLEHFMSFSAILCMISYLLIVFIPSPIAGAIACCTSGFAVGIMWPGTFSLASATIKNGGTAMFALMALAGDLGCSSGPTVVGRISGMFDDNLRVGILVAIVFPTLLFVGVWIVTMYYQKRGKKDDFRSYNY